MSVLVNVKFWGDTARAVQTFRDRADELATFTEQARASGCLHHRFGLGDGFIVVQDEWDSAGDFEKFMERPELQAFIAESGADPTPPEVTISEALSTADEF
jgi:quinol monooxygenase YgiN